MTQWKKAVRTDAKIDAKSVESSRAIVEAERVMPVDFAHNAALHYAKALRKHPRFADELFFRGEHDESERAKLLPDVERYLKLAHRDIARDEANRSLEAHSLLTCEYREALAEFVKGDNAACVGELYDAVAVLMRMIAVVEGKQRLGGEK